MEIPVGPGTQSLKWLGLVAAQRHALLAKHTKTGRRSFVKQPDEGQGFFLPEDMVGPGGRLAPSSIIRDVIQEGEIIQIDLQTTVELDEINAPKQTPWQVAAFECGAASARRRRGIESREAIAAHEASIKAEVDAQRKAMGLPSVGGGRRRSIGLPHRRGGPLAGRKRPIATHRTKRIYFESCSSRPSRSS